MPRYKRKQSSGDKHPFRRKYRALNHRQLTHFLKNAPKGFWEELQKESATHRTRTHPSKLLQSSFDTIENTRTPSQFNAKLTAEDMQHGDREDNFHKGGGLSETVNSIMSAMWDHLPDSVANLIKTPEYGEDVSQMDRWNADVVRQAYEQNIDKRERSIHGWIRLPRFDSPYVAAYWDPKKNNVYVAVRGSITAEDWLYHDAGIAIDNHPGQKLVDQVRGELVEIAKEFPKAKLTLNSHSLGGAIVTDSILAASDEEKTWLDNYSQLNYFNAGSSPIANLEPIKEIVKDSRVKLFVNRSDMINQAYNQERLEDTRVSFADAAWNPITAHGMAQWGSDDIEADKAVNWGRDPYQEFNNSTWEAGDATTSALAALEVKD